MCLENAHTSKAQNNGFEAGLQMSSNTRFLPPDIALLYTALIYTSHHSDSHIVLLM